MHRKRTVISDSIWFNGIEFRRYPNAKNWADQNYYRPGGSDVIRGIQSLHREIWKTAHGPIPEGCDIHHKDNNPLNNDLSNLECLTAEEHQARHGNKTKSEEWIVGRTEHLQSVRHLASEWHRSEEGRAWHREHAKTVADQREFVTKVCAHCGVSYQTKDTRTKARFCSSRCKERNSYEDRKVSLHCAVCGSEFKRPRTSKATHCSMKCAAIGRWNKD